MSESTGASAPAAPSAPAAAAPVAEASTELTDADLAAEAAEEGAEPETKAEKKAESQKRKYQLKVNNKDREIEFDPSDEKEMIKYLSKAMASDEKFQEAATLRKQVEHLINELKTNPKAILKHKALGLDARKLAEEILNEEMEEMTKSPEQKRMEEMEQRLKAYEEDKLKADEAAKEAEMEHLHAQASQQLDNDIVEALSGSNIPKVPYVIKRITDTMLEAVRMGYKDVTVKDIFPFVEQQIMEEFHGVFDNSTDETFEKLVNKKNLDRYRKARVAKAKKPVATANQVKDTGKKSETKTEEKKQRMSDFFKPF